MNKRVIECRLKALQKKIDELDTVTVVTNGVDSYLTGGQIQGQTLILTQTSFGNVNIPLIGIERAINFTNLTGLQKQALAECIRGDLVADAFDEPLGYLISKDL